MAALDDVTLDEIRAARENIRGLAIRTPLLRLHSDRVPPDTEVYLKCENLQPIGCYKVRCAANALLSVDTTRGLHTCSAGNFGQGAAYVAAQRGVPCGVLVPDTAAQPKLDAMRKMGAEIRAVPFADWFAAVQARHVPGMPGVFVHPVADRAVLAGNGTIALEIVEDMPEVDTVLAAFGGGALTTGLAIAMRHVRPSARVFACEISTGAPLAPSLAAGRPVSVEYTTSWVDGCGSSGLLDEMWEPVRKHVAGALVVTPEQTAQAVRTLATQAHIVAEGCVVSRAFVAWFGC
eukprot:TRINITY_DN5677_c0_g1_i1.p1 TRINITY_DN5677_c0_g1~~TRINITY_DN5677_c0_g1_i1.p1  ORF type:complete len:291 (+),score=50.46 TRINITY_DN5677_c0_g1_i1:137-1009(+)